MVPRLRACGHTVMTLVILELSPIRPLGMGLRLKSAPVGLGVVHSVTSPVKKPVHVL